MANLPLFASPNLHPHHLKMLREESAISDEVIQARGYQTAISKRSLQDMGFGLAQRIAPTLVIPVRNVNGDLVMRHHRPDQPRMRNGKIAKYEMPAGCHMAIDVHPLITEKIRDPSVPLFITEGCKKADAAITIGLCCIALIGVWNWRGTNEWGGKTALPDWDGIALKDGQNRARQVYIVYDSDVMLKREVSQALARLGAFLTQRGARVAFVYLPAGEDGRKVGLDDYLAQGHAAPDLLALASSELRETTPQETPDDALPSVETNGRQMRDVVSDAVAALVASNNPPDAFVRNGRLTFVDRDEDGRSHIGTHTLPTMRNRLAACANWHSTSEKRGKIDVFAPRDIAEAVVSLPAWPGVPALAGIVTAPVVAPDGTLLTTPGYHARARLYYDAPDGAALPDTTPTAEACAAAKSLLLDDLLADFPFADDASRAHTLAMLLLPFVRPLISGPTPLHLIDAPKAGTGKGLLAQACTNVFAPAGVPLQSLPTREEEWGKLLTSVFRAGGSHLILDNARSMNSPALFAALTSETWQDRALGSNDVITSPNRLIWIATANNISGNDELTRRAIWIRLDAGVEQPDERQEFRHDDLLTWGKEHHRALVGAALTLVRSWLKAGRPLCTAQTLGSFAAWSRVMGGLLETIGVPGFLGNRDGLRSRADEETTAWHGFFEAWDQAWGDKPSSCDDLLPIAIHWFAQRIEGGKNNPTPQTQKTRLGKMLGGSVDRVYNGFKLASAPKVSSGPNKGAAQYRLVRMGKVGNVGNVSNPHIESIVTLDNSMSHNTLLGEPHNVPHIPHLPLNSRNGATLTATETDELDEVFI